MSVGNERDSRSNALAWKDSLVLLAPHGIHCGDALLELISEASAQPLSEIYALKG